MKSEVNRILTLLTNMIATQSTEIEQSYHVSVQIDFIIAKGRLAHEMNGVSADIGKHMKMVLKRLDTH